MTDAESPDTSIPLRVGERPPVPGAVKVEIVNDGSGRHHTARTKARKAALDLLYDADVTGRHPLDLLDDADETDKVRPLTRELVSGVADGVLDIDRRIASALTGDWTLDRMPALDRALARMACWELMHTATPPAAVIAEAVALADEYSTDGSAGFLSSVLGAVASRVDERGHEPEVPASWLDAEAAAAPSADDMGAYLLDKPDTWQDETPVTKPSWLDAEAANAPSADEMAAFLHDVPAALNAED